MMTADHFRAVLDRHGLKPTGTEAAARLGVHRNTVRRWASGETVITAPAAALIRETFPR